LAHEPPLGLAAESAASCNWKFGPVRPMPTLPEPWRMTNLSTRSSVAMETRETPAIKLPAPPGLVYPNRIALPLVSGVRTSSLAPGETVPMPTPPEARMRNWLLAVEETVAEVESAQTNEPRCKALAPRPAAKA